MPRFFIDPSAVSEGKILITGEDAHHIGRVLRMKPGEALTVCDYFNTEYACVIEAILKDSVLLSISASAPSKSEPSFPIALYMALPKGDKMELIIQKATELGVTDIIPFSSAFTVVKLDDQSAPKKRERWQKIARSAAEQCGRGKIPTVHLPTAFKNALADGNARTGMHLFCYECEEKQTLKALFENHPSPKGISFFVGAEGGFSKEEAALAKASGYCSVSLGKRILRCETAPLYLLSALSFFYESN